MSLHIFSHEELYETLEKYPKLKWDSRSCLYGTIDLHHRYDDFTVKDSFMVAISAPEDYPSSPPFLVEAGGRTKQIANKYKLSGVEDLHCNVSGGVGIACLCANQEYKILFPAGSDLVVFIDDLVIPYLYGLSYFDTHGKWATWGERSHGVLGLLEAHYEIKDVEKAEVLYLVNAIKGASGWTSYHKQLKTPQPLKACPCGKNRSFEDCHARAWLGLMKLRTDLLSLNINIKNLFNFVSLNE